MTAASGASRRLSRASGRPLLLDGAMGTELDRRGVDTRLPLWSAAALRTAPEVVRDIHVDYLLAGADIITTNTFRTTGRTLRHAGLDPAGAGELTRRAVALAQAAREHAGAPAALIAGSIAPLEDCYSPWLTPGPDIAYAEHLDQARALATAGVDLLLIETMPTVREAVAAATAGATTGLPLLVGFTCRLDAQGAPEVLDGASLATAAAALRDLPLAGLVVNCAPPAVIEAGVVALRATTSLVIGAYANLGEVEPTVGWRAAAGIPGDRYAAAATRWVDAGAGVVGGCCGTSVAHIAALRAALGARVGSTASTGFTAPAPAGQHHGA